MVTRFVALVGVTLISFTAIFVRLADTTPITATLFRAAYAVPPLTAAAWMVRRRDPRPGRMRLVAFASGIILAIDLTLFHHTIDLIGAGLATLLASTQVVFVGVAAWLLHRERPTRAALTTVPVVLAGVILLSGLGRSDSYGDSPITGALIGLATGAAYASFLLVFRASNRRYLAPTAGPLFDATVGTVAGAIILTPLVGGLDLAPGWETTGWLVAVALVGQTVGWLLISVALPRLAALDTSILLLLQPAAALLWAFLIFTEELSYVQWTGVVLVLGGIAALSLRGAAATAPTGPGPAPVLADPA